MSPQWTVIFNAQTSGHWFSTPGGKIVVTNNSITAGQQSWVDDTSHTGSNAGIAQGSYTGKKPGVGLRTHTDFDADTNYKIKIIWEAYLPAHYTQANSDTETAARHTIHASYNNGKPGIETTEIYLYVYKENGYELDTFTDNYAQSWSYGLGAGYTEHGNVAKGWPILGHQFEDLTQRDNVGLSEGSANKNKGLHIGSYSSWGYGLLQGTELKITQLRKIKKQNNTTIAIGDLWKGPSDKPIPPTTVPIITQFNPAHNSTNIAKDTNIVFTFDKNIFTIGNKYLNIVSVPAGSYSNTTEITSQDITISGNTLTFNPPSDLPEGTQLDITIDAGALGAFGAPSWFAGLFASAYRFTTLDSSAALSMVSFWPGPNDAVTRFTRQIIITFNNPVSVNPNTTLLPGSPFDYSFYYPKIMIRRGGRGGTQAAVAYQGSFTMFNQFTQLVPSNNSKTWTLTPGTSEPSWGSHAYTFSIDAGVFVDAAGNTNSAYGGHSITVTPT